jgi:hypothetical protein
MNSVIREPVIINALLLCLLSVACLLMVLIGLKAALPGTGWTSTRQNKIFYTTIIVIAAWVIALAVLSLRGFFSEFNKWPPRPAFAVLIPLPVVLIITFSASFKEILKATPPQWLLYMQAFRIFVELLLWNAFLKNLLPVQMTFEGRNFDVLTGILALPVGYFCFVKKRWPKSIAVAFNITGLGLLLNIVVIAVLSMPTPFRHFMNEPANTLVGYFPFIYLPGILVVLAYTLHIFSLRQLLLKK